MNSQYKKEERQIANENIKKKLVTLSSLKIANENKEI